jgi:hypothetical protein
MDGVEDTLILGQPAAFGLPGRDCDDLGSTFVAQSAGVSGSCGGSS